MRFLLACTLTCDVMRGFDWPVPFHLAKNDALIGVKLNRVFMVVGLLREYPHVRF